MFDNCAQSSTRQRGANGDALPQNAEAPHSSGMHTQAWCSRPWHSIAATFECHSCVLSFTQVAEERRLKRNKLQQIRRRSKKVSTSLSSLSLSHTRTHTRTHTRNSSGCSSHARARSFFNLRDFFDMWFVVGGLWFVKLFDL